MTDNRLNNLFLLHIHSEKTDELDEFDEKTDEVATAFTSVNQRRVNYFGKITV